MDKMSIDNNSTRKNQTAEMIGSFIQNRRISHRDISLKSGINSSNLSKCLKGTTSLTLPYFVRISTAADSDELYDWVFDIPVKRYLAQSVKNQNICSAVDYVYLLILLKDYYIHRNKHNAEDILNLVFYELASRIFKINKENGYASCTDLFLCNAFYNRNNPIMLSFPDTPISDHQLGLLMQEGSSIIWDDIRDLINWYQEDNQNNLKALRCKNLLYRIMNTSMHSYKIEDLLAADNELQMNGIFFSACCLASKSKLLLNRVCNTNPVDNADHSEELHYGVTTFISCIRTLGKDPEGNRDLQKFWAFFRKTAAENQYYMDLLRSFLDGLPEYFPRMPLRFYSES